MKPRLATVVLISIVAAFPLRSAAARGPVSEDVPVSGGTAALAKSFGVDPAPDRARFVSEMVRLAHLAAEDRGNNKRKPAAARGRDRVKAEPPAAAVDSVPIPLTVALWSQAVFHRAIPADQIVAAIINDTRASFLCYGLTGLDDDTLQFLIDHPSTITRLYERAAAAFAGSASNLRIRDNRVVVPGGAAAADMWASVVGASPANPEAFIRALFGQDEGRLAYLYDVIGDLDAPRVSFALGLWIKDPAVRLKRFKALVLLNKSAIPQWQPARLPFTRPLYDVASLLARVQVEADGSPSFPVLRSEWAWVFASADLPQGRPVIKPTADDGPIDAAALAQLVVLADTRERGVRMDQLAFGQRVFGHAEPAVRDPVLVAIRTFPNYRMLMLTLERCGVRAPALYEAAARRAHQLTSLDDTRLFVALGQFQSALALVARMASVRTLDARMTESLISGLVGVPLNHDGHYGGALAKWVEHDLGSVLVERVGPGIPAPADPRLLVRLDLEEAMLHAAAGAPPSADAGAAVPWEGNVYRVDIAASERRRLRRIREKQGGLTLDAALAQGKDEALAGALMAWTYAVSIADPESPVLLTTTAIRRHDFGLVGERAQRQRTPWAMPRQEIAVGVPWHVSGSLLGLDVALSGLALRRIAGDRAIDAPTMSSNEREAFSATVALLNPYDMQDRDRDAIASAVERGRLRIASIAENHAGAEEAAAEIRMDGWRRRALNWTVAHEPDRVVSFFSMTELLLLGRGAVSDFSAWGMAALASSGCVCTRLLPSNLWRALAGRPQLGLMASTVADLNLRVAIALGELRLPAAAAKSVLSAAVQDFVDEVRPADFNDWLTLVRTAQALPRERIEDYVAVATADGPLVPQEP